MLEDLGDVGMAGGEGLLADGQGPAEEGFGLGVEAFRLVGFGQMIEAAGDERMVVAQAQFNRASARLWSDSASTGLPLARSISPRVSRQLATSLCPGPRAFS